MSDVYSQKDIESIGLFQLLVLTIAIGTLIAWKDFNSSSTRTPRY
jgi:hypothetical protein